MKHFPFPVRVAAGLAATTADTVRDLPKHLTELPVTVASQVLQTSMRVQQHVTELAIKGDDALAGFRGVDDEPNWATFDEDDLPPAPGARTEPSTGAGTAQDGPTVDPAAFDDPWDAESQALGEEHADGEFDSADLPDEGAANADASAADDATDEATDDEARAEARADEARAAADSSEGPAGVQNYDALTLPQLRSRLRSFSADELEELLGYERAHENRPSFTGMLTRRIANVRAESNGETGTTGDTPAS